MEPSSLKLPSALFKPKFQKIKKNPPPPKKILIFQEMEISNSQKLLIKLLYTLNKTPLGETGCLSKLYYLLAAQAFSFLIHPLFSDTVSQDTLNCSLKKYIFKIVP